MFTKNEKIVHPEAERIQTQSTRHAVILKRIFNVSNAGYLNRTVYIMLVLA